MRTDLKKSADKMVNKRKWYKRWQKAVSSLAIVTVFCTTYALILPAITVTADTYCGKDEHKHTEECYTRQLVCGLEEGEGTEATTETKEVVTTETETVLVDEGHTHTDACYETTAVLTCSLEEQAAQDAVIDEETGEVITPAVEGHTHGESCYETTTDLVCGQEEREAVYEEKEVEVVSTVEEEVAAAEGHKHTDECYEKTLTCDKEEHEHSDTCFANKGADLESAADWEKTLPSKEELTGEWNQDTLLIAKSQLGYKESSVNFVVDGGERKGYTRYGAMMGVPYGDWCAMFLQFSLHYAGVDTKLMAGSPAVPTWVREAQSKDQYRSAGAYTPNATDIIFFDWDHNGSADHIGIVEEVEYNQDGDAVKVITIEGNSSNMVRRNTYKATDKDIMGYAIIPEKPETETEEAETTTDVEIADNQVITATIYTDATYEVVDDADEATITIEGSLPVAAIATEAEDEDADPEDEAEDTAKEVIIEAKAYPTELDEIVIEEGEEVLLAYDITLFYKDGYKPEDAEDTFQPVDGSLKVGFESPILTEAAEDVTKSLSVVYVPDESGVAQVVAEEADKDMSVETDGETAKVTFEADHFSQYGVKSVPQNVVEVSNWDEFKAAVESGNDVTIKIVSDLVATKPAHVQPNQVVAIQGEGHTIYRQQGSNFSADGENGGYITADAGSELIIDNTNFSGKAHNGTSVVENYAWNEHTTNLNRNGKPQGAFIGFDGSKLTITNSTFKDLVGDENLTNTAPIVVNDGNVTIVDTKINDNYLRPSRTTTPSIEGYNNTYGILENMNYHLGSEGDKKRTSDADAEYCGSPGSGKADGYYENDPKKTSGAITINGGNVTISGAGTQLNGNIGSVGAVTITGGTFTQNGGSIDQNNGFHAGAVSVVNGIYNLNSGQVNGNKGVWFGTVNIVDNNGTFNMGFTGGYPTINNNQNLHKGGAVYINSDNVHLEAGELANNKALVYGGAVYIEKDHTTVIEDAAIYDNWARAPLRSDYKVLQSIAGYPIGHGGGFWSCPDGDTFFNANEVAIFGNDADYDRDKVHYYSGDKELKKGADYYLEGGTQVEFITNEEWLDENNNNAKVTSVDQFVRAHNTYALDNPNKINNTDINNRYNPNNSRYKLRIHNNEAPNGGGIASNGNLALATTTTEIEAKIKFQKNYDEGATVKDVRVTVRLYDQNGNQVKDDIVTTVDAGGNMSGEIVLPTTTVEGGDQEEAYKELISFSDLKDMGLGENALGTWKIVIQEEVKEGDNWVTAEPQYEVDINDFAGIIDTNSSRDGNIITFRKTYILQASINNHENLVPVKIKKVDSVTGETLSGATFTYREVTESLNDPPKFNETAEKGIYEADEELDPRNVYVIWENDAPNGYSELGYDIPFKFVDRKAELITNYNDLPKNSNLYLNGKYYKDMTEAEVNSALADLANMVSIDGDDASKLTIKIKNIKNPEIKIIKVDAADETKPLQGAKFDLKDESGKTIKSIVTGRDGRADLGTLKPGKYELIETEAPKGYNLLKEPVTITVNKDGTATYSQPTNAKSNTQTGGSELDNDKIEELDAIGYEFKITNSSGVVLPNTGGTGTTIYTMAGLMLAIGASASLMYKKLRRREVAKRG